MNPNLLYHQLAEVSKDFYRTITHLSLTTQKIDRCALEALWVRLDDLVEQIPEALDALTSDTEEA